MRHPPSPHWPSDYGSWDTPDTPGGGGEKAVAQPRRLLAASLSFLGALTPATRSVPSRGREKMAQRGGGSGWGGGGFRSPRAAMLPSYEMSVQPSNWTVLAPSLKTHQCVSHFLMSTQRVCLFTKFRAAPQIEQANSVGDPRPRQRP